MVVVNWEYFITKVLCTTQKVLNFQKVEGGGMGVSAAAEAQMY